MAHRSLARRWRLEKIDLHKDVHILDQLRVEGAGAPWTVQLDQALDFWEECEQECSQLPGYIDASSIEADRSHQQNLDLASQSNEGVEAESRTKKILTFQ